MNITEELSKYDSISLKDTSLVIDSGENQIDLKLQYCHFKSLKHSIVNQLGDDEKRVLIKELEESLCK